MTKPRWFIPLKPSVIHHIIWDPVDQRLYVRYCKGDPQYTLWNMMPMSPKEVDAWAASPAGALWVWLETTVEPSAPKEEDA